MNRASLFPLATIILLAPATAVAQDRSRNPHGKLQEECGVCHSPEAWVPARISPRFDHAKKGFGLAGAHAQTICRSCHASLDFRGTARDCVSCHRDVHRGELGVECARCHTPRSFLDRANMARSHQLTRFALTGSHLTLDCELCHTPTPQGRLTYVNRSTDCVDCHLTAYRGAKNPDHEAGGFPRDCNQCHSTSTWPRARFNHAATRFPLTGAHRAVACQQCHGDGVYSGKVALCISCHQQDYDRVANPNHRAAQFSTDCTICHTTVAWTGTGFDHTGTRFPLTGAHLTVACQQCHGDGVYQGKSTLCVSCHQQDYDRTTNPNHLAAQFSTDCTTCHNTTTWTGAQFNHDASFFPIYSGAHRGKWASCSTCHIDPNNFRVFTCLGCHAHDQIKMDDKHLGKSGYRYDSQACYSCHPQGRKQ